MDKRIDRTEMPASPATAGETEERIDIRKISTAQLAKLGLTQIAYVKPIFVDGAPAFGIHAADGTPMAIAEDRDVAIAAIAQHEMIAATLH